MCCIVLVLPLQIVTWILCIILLKISAETLAFVYFSFRSLLLGTGFKDILKP